MASAVGAALRFAYDRHWCEVLLVAVAIDSETAADLVALASDRPPLHLLGRYGDLFRGIAVAMGKGEHVTPAETLARMDRQRRRWINGSDSRDASERQRSTDRTIRLPWRGPIQDRRPMGPKFGGIPSGPIGDPEVATHGSIGRKPGDRRVEAESEYLTGIAQTINRANTGKRPGNVAGGGFDTPGGGYCARPGYRPRRKRR